MITWDEAKRRSNLEKHDLDFADASLVYDSPDKVTVESPRKNERRLVDLAFVEPAGAVLALVYTQRGESIRVISFRVASRGERRFYEQTRKQD